MKTILEFIQERQRASRFITEGIRTQDMQRAIDLITKYLQKKCEHIIGLPVPETFNLDGMPLIGMRWLNCKTGANIRIGWTGDASGSNNAYCVDFFKDASELLSGEGRTDLSVYTNGASMVLILPLIVEVFNTGKYDADTALVKKLNAATIGESLNEDIRWELTKKKKSLQSQKTGKVQAGDAEAVARLEDDIARINDAIASGDEETMNVTLLSFKKDVPTITTLSTSMSAAQKKADTASNEIYSNPKTAFKMMEKYLTLAIKGDRNIVLICGAPGVGKTFRVKKYLNSIINDATGDNYIWADDIDGINGDIFLVKGKCSAPALYKMLWRSREENKILFIDDADSILLDENSINLLKAAGEGGRDRTVTWAISGKIYDSDPDDPSEQIEVPKSFKYNGKIIILTNYRAGQVDTAVRSRAYIQDINFTVQSVLEIIRTVMPTMNDQGLTDEGKEKAYGYLEQLAEEGAPMEISLRTFGTCAAIFSVVGSSGDPEDEALVMEMISEQMRLQSSRGGKKY